LPVTLLTEEKKIKKKKKIGIFKNLFIVPWGNVSLKKQRIYHKIISISFIFKITRGILEIKILYIFGENLSRNEVARVHTSNNSQNSVFY
jgi:hypothetical protein